MKPLLAFAFVLAFAVAAAADEFAPDPGDRSPEQHPGQLAEMRLAMLYPRFEPEPGHVPAADPSERLLDFLRDSQPVLKNYRKLSAYLREGLRDPIGTRGINAATWKAAWTATDGALDHEVARLKALLREGESIQAAGIPPQAQFFPSQDGYARLEDKAEFDGPLGERLHQGNTLAASVRNMREFLIRKSREAAQSRHQFEAADRATAPLSTPLPR